MGSDILSHGVAVGDVSSQGALLWLRTDGPASVQVEWATVARWKQASKLATAVAPVSRTSFITTTEETDYTLTIPLEGLSPATRYRYHVLIGSADQTTRQLPASPAAKGGSRVRVRLSHYSDVPRSQSWGGPGDQRGPQDSGGPENEEGPANSSPCRMRRSPPRSRSLGAATSAVRDDAGRERAAIPSSM
ncbi:PhoD-like phosphatase N-terminal domain-containing protein [Candidatus Nitrospira nitrificans]|uniref:PhoD-like phosphatase N-terminal domain-containing protein n=1 Tax=Candidatus Nitrospira nitrificans TaxID=1742973 RepID=UPI001584BD43|nr:PhoD-like phosphatase N-terminal domain-containing protein [Candidatus Nitrospira nitrificans]